jgi:hypothetical protein
MTRSKLHFFDKRKKRATGVSIAICSIIAIPVIYFCFTRQEDEYYIDNDVAIKNTTDACYRKSEPKTFPHLFSIVLGVFSILAGLMVSRSTLIIEELYHLEQRYGGSWKKMIKACFSGLAKTSFMIFVGASFISFTVLLLLKDKRSIQPKVYAMYFFTGLTVGPLIKQLLHLDTQSEVSISTILDEKETRPAHTLAWSYYFTHIVPSLRDFDRAKNDNSTAFRQLTTNKLLFLVSLGECGDYGQDFDTLIRGDRYITKITNNYLTKNYNIPVYSLKDERDINSRYALKHIREPLAVLSSMDVQNVKSVKDDTIENHIKLLYQTLQDILESQQLEETCILIPIDMPFERGYLSDRKGIPILNSITKEVQPSFPRGDARQYPAWQFISAISGWVWRGLGLG